MRSWSKVVLFAVALGAASLTGLEEARAASCSAAEASEMVRLRAELGRLVGKNQHKGAVATFEKMLVLGKQKCEIKPDDYKLAAAAARNYGDIADAIEWSNAGGVPSDAAEFATRFGQVKISEKAGDLVKDSGLPFMPDERAALARVQEEVKATGKFTGYLPLGTYKLGTKSFEVKASGVTKV